MLMRSWHYGLMNTLLAVNIALLLHGGPWLWAGFLAAVILATLVDEAAGDEVAVLSEAPVHLLNAMLYLTLPLVLLNWVVALLLLAPAGHALDAPLAALGADLPAARAATGHFALLGMVLGLGLFIGAAATNVAHELVHRSGSLAAQICGRWLLAFSFDTTFAIEHVQGHHRHVGTAADPATARRGEYVLAFAWRSLVDGNRSAFRIEAARLARKGFPVISWRNRALRGQAMSLALLALAFWIAGWSGIVAALIAGIQGKLYLELVNYIEHYGLVRVPGRRIEARHSWNTYRRISSGLLYNLPRHSHHHLFATKPFWTLEREPEGPTYPHGYLTLIGIALLPGLWHRLVDPLLADWDRRQASDEERALLAEQGMLRADKP